MILLPVTQILDARLDATQVTRDRLMMEYHDKYPGYDFASHKGYGTAKHMQALKELGPCPIHRLSYAPCAAAAAVNAQRPAHS